jgi:hypothetical protein
MKIKQILLSMLAALTFGSVISAETQALPLYTPLESRTAMQ